VSVGPGGRQGNGDSANGGGVAVSADGRFVVFNSRASNLVPGDGNDTDDTFVRDRRSGRTEKVSLGVGGAQGDIGSSGYVESRLAISAGGRFVVFSSEATDLVPHDTNAMPDVFVRDRLMNVTERVSVATGGGEGDNYSYGGAVSAGGRFVAFASAADDLVTGDDNRAEDVFVRDRAAGVTERVSVGPGGRQGNGKSFLPSISGDGRFVAFASEASDLVAHDGNGLRDVFVRDRLEGTTELVSRGSGVLSSRAEATDPSISADGRFVAFSSLSLAGEQEVFVRDRLRRTTELVSVGPDGHPAEGFFTGRPSISAAGRHVAFVSNSIFPYTGTYEVFVRDRERRTTALASLRQAGVPGDGASGDAAISADGRVAAFSSEATNLVARDTNGVSDVFVRRR
jgi:Tol biopolymer transport system component